MKIEKRRMGSAERQLYNEFTETEQLESEELNKIAKIVLERIIDKSLTQQLLPFSCCSSLSLVFFFWFIHIFI